MTLLDWTRTPDNRGCTDAWQASAGELLFYVERWEDSYEGGVVCPACGTLPITADPINPHNPVVYMPTSDEIVAWIEAWVVEQVEGQIEREADEAEPKRLVQLLRCPVCNKAAKP